MPLRRTGSSIPQLDWNSADWDRWERDRQVIPDDGSVTPDSLAEETVISIEAQANAAAGSALATHVAAADPHPIYATDAAASALAANAQAAAVANASAALAAHVAAADPHPGYLTQAEGDARFQPLAMVLSFFHTGTGTPEGSLAAAVGHVYLRTDGATGTTLYVKETGGSTATGWVPK